MKKIVFIALLLSVSVCVSMKPDNLAITYAESSLLEKVTSDFKYMKQRQPISFYTSTFLQYTGGIGSIGSFLYSVISYVRAGRPHSMCSALNRRLRFGVFGALLSLIALEIGNSKKHSFLQTLQQDKYPKK